MSSDPNMAEAEVARLLAKAKQALMTGQWATARGLHEDVTRARPGEITAWIGLAATCRQMGDIPGALKAVDRALAISPRLFPALLMRATLLERSGEQRAAGKAFGIALTQAPPEDQLDPPSREATRHARTVHQRYIADQMAFVQDTMENAASDLTTKEAARLTDFLEFAVGQKSRYRSQPTHFYYPDLPEVGFHSRVEFPWLDELEAQTEDIAGEAFDALSADKNLVPYIDYPDNLPLDQWSALNRSTNWSAFHLYYYGKLNRGNARDCPKALAAVRNIPQPVMRNKSPALMFSILKPDTHIPPHTGVTNTRLVFHLPLIIPEACAFRVGAETRPWIKGQAWVFDDTIEHEAWNNSTRPRVVMIGDVWRPELSEGERAQIVALMDALDAFDGEEANAGAGDI